MDFINDLQICMDFILILILPIIFLFILILTDLTRMMTTSKQN